MGVTGREVGFELGQRAIDVNGSVDGAGDDIGDSNDCDEPPSGLATAASVAVTFSVRGGASNKRWSAAMTLLTPS